MNQIKSIFKNTSWMTVSQAVTSLCAFIWTIIIARYLGVSDYGIVSFAISFTALTIIIMDLGMSTYATRELSRDKNQISKYVNNILPFKILLSIALFLISWVILYLMGYDVLTIEVTLIFTIEMFFMSMVNFFNGIFQAFEELKYQAMGTILNSGLLLVGILITIGLNLGVIAIAGSYTVAYLIFLIFMIIKFVQKFGVPGFEFDLSFWKDTVIKSAPFGLTNFFYTIYFSIDIVMLSYLSGDYATGLYKSAYNIINVFTTFYAVYQFTIFPVMSKFFVESKNLLKVSYEQSVKYLLLIILPISIYALLYARPIINLIYSNQYSLASVPMQILIWTVAFLFVNGAASVLLNAIDKEFTVTKIYIVAAVFNVILNSIMIPNFGYNGAAIATVLSEILICGLTTYCIFKTDFKPDWNLLKTVFKLIISTIVLGIVLYYVNINMWLAIPIGFVVYVVMLFITRTIDDVDKFIIKELLDKN